MPVQVFLIDQRDRDVPDSETAKLLSRASNQEVTSEMLQSYIPPGQQMPALEEVALVPYRDVESKDFKANHGQLDVARYRIEQLQDRLARNPDDLEVKQELDENRKLVQSMSNKHDFLPSVARILDSSNNEQIRRRES